MTDRTAVFDARIVRGAARDSVRKLAPRAMLKNPVMAIVLRCSVLVTVVFVRDLGSSTRAENSRILA